MLAGAEPSLKVQLGLTDLTSFHYLRGGMKGTTRDFAIDVDMSNMSSQFQALLSSMADVGFKTVRHRFSRYCVIFHNS